MNAPNPRFAAATLYDRYRIEVQVRTRLCGGMPRNKELIRAWVESTRPKNEEPDPAATEALVQADAELVVNEVAEKSWTGFPEDAERGLFLPCRQVKALIKQSASLLAITKQKRGSKQILAEGCEVKALDGSDRIYFDRKTPDGTEEKAIHVMTAQGPRSALARFDYVTRPKLAFEIWVLKTHAAETRHIGEDELVRILTHAQENGLGASRSQGEGKFDVLTFNKLE